MRNFWLGVRSSYSFLYGVRGPEEIADKAISLGITHLGITDRDNLYGVHTIIEACKERGITPVIGAELTSPEGNLFAFVENQNGFSLLCKLLTRKKQHRNSFNLVSFLKENARGLILVSLYPNILKSLSTCVPELYAGISIDNLGTIRTARQYNLPLAYLDDATLFDDEDYKVHKTLRAIELGKTIGSLTSEDIIKPHTGYFPVPRDVQKKLSSWAEAFKGTEEIISRCTFNTLFKGFIFPKYSENTDGAAHKEQPAFSILRDRVIAGAEKRYGELSDAIIGRIDYELDIIESKGFAPYFLVIDDIVSMASRTCGRGSGAASIVSYSLGITNVDPIARELYFERFLNKARSDPPDIDVDFAWDERDDIIKRVIAHFGEDHCARVANHNFFRLRSAIRESAKAYGFPDGEVSRMERNFLDLKNETDLNDPLWKEILTMTKRIEGLPRGLSMHCGGLVITPEPISHYAPIETSVDGYPLLCWEKEGAEAAGFVKIDLLGNRSLAVIRDALENMEKDGIHFDRNLWNPSEDSETIAALARGDSMGVFYIESPAMRQLQKKTGCGDFEHIVIHSSLIRPAANRFISEYVRRLKGGEWKSLHPRLDNILDESYGILCYQEDVSKAAIAMASFDEADADLLRKVISKKAHGTKLKVYEEQFFSGCRKNGVSEKTIKEVWAMMLSFDGYSFCKPHSASYAMVSFQSAYLRVHYPAYFMAAVLSNQGGYYQPLAYISEARRMGISVTGPDINESRTRYYAKGNTLVIGFMAIANLSETGITALIDNRESYGSFGHISQISKRINLSRDDIIALIAGGVFDSIAEGIPRALQVRMLLSSSSMSTIHKTRNQQELGFSGNNVFAVTSQLLQNFEQDRQRKLLQLNHEKKEEFSSLGFLRDAHPLSLWKKELDNIQRVLARDLKKMIGRTVTLIGWPITRKDVRTKDNEVMTFVSFEDETDIYETVLFPAVYQKYYSLLFDSQPLIVSGKVENDDAININIENLKRLS